MSYEEITSLLEKYSEKQPNELWTPQTEIKKMEIIRLNEKWDLFDGINSEYFTTIDYITSNSCKTYIIYT